MHLTRPAMRMCLNSLALLCLLAHPAQATSDALFETGVKAYAAGEFLSAAQVFRSLAQQSPSAGALQNLGNAEWKLGRTGEAVLAWERALWVDAYNKAARGNLKFARRTYQLESPELAWYEVISTWLPVNWWAWITGLSLWGSVGMVAIPAFLRRPKSSWNQAAAAFGLMLFLLSLPALLGVNTRSKLGFVLQRNTPLLLTPTRDGQAITHLAAGDPARLKRFRGDFALVRAGRSTGWVERSRLGLICPQNGSPDNHPRGEPPLAASVTP